MIRSEIGHTTPVSITVRNVDLASDIIGRMDFVETLFLCALARRPSLEEKAVVNALLVVALDHGLTPSSIAARLTYTGAPDSIPGAVAAGLLGAGSRYLGPSAIVAHKFKEWTATLLDDDSAAAYAAVAKKIVDSQKDSGSRLPGFGHPIHKAGDPRVPALRRVVESNGFYGKGWKLADAVGELLSDARPPVPMNASGAVGVTIVDMGIEPAFAIGLTLVGRCGGLVAHIIEEIASPVGQDIWELIATQDPRVDFGRPR